jgi:L-threonylcarbamoyladenylate synthase
MATLVVVLDPARPDPQQIRRAGTRLRQGDLVAFPTETVYGLGANALDPLAVRRIFQAKGRPGTNPLIVHLADAQQVKAVVSEWPASAARLAKQFWPGPLTLILPRLAVVPDEVTAGRNTVGVRVPAHPLALAVIRAAGVPVAAPSANRSNHLSPTLALHVLADLDGRIDLILDGGPTPGGLESTVLDLTVSPPRILRPGLVTRSALEPVIGEVEEGRRAGESLSSSSALPSPGMLPRHYAPQTLLECVEGDLERRGEELLRQGQRVVCVRFGGVSSREGEVILPAEPRASAVQLYAVLHQLDAGGYDRILVELPPDTEPWRAIRDRLLRGSLRPQGGLRDPL